LGNLSLVAPLANILLVPVVPYIMLLVTLALVCGLIWQPFGQVAALVAWGPLTWLTEGARLVSQMPGAATQLPPFPLWMLLAYYAVCVLSPKNEASGYDRVVLTGGRMKARQHTAEQIIKILEYAEQGDQTVAAVCRTHGIAEATFYRWRTMYGGMTVHEVQRLKTLEQENAQLKRLLAERMLEVDALKAVLGKKR